MRQEGRQEEKKAERQVTNNGQANKRMDGWAVRQTDRRKGEWAESQGRKYVI
jgi:hypothetical protein